MLQVDDPTRPLPPDVLDVPGGFAWWYVDGLDDRGDGLVLIGAWALPFWPGDRAARLARGATPASARPSLNLALYRGGRLASYTLLGVEHARWDADGMTLGASHLRRVDADGRGRLEASIDVPVPGSAERLVGQIVCEGPLAGGEDADATPPEGHRWAPVFGASTIRARFHHGATEVLNLQGSGYHDRNASGTPLDALGIDVWTWGRQAFGDLLVIHYLTWAKGPEAPSLLIVTVDGAGRRRVHRDVPVERLEPHASWLGRPWWGRLRAKIDGVPFEVRHHPPTDRGPFYLRFQTEATLGDQRARGWAELCRPDRIDLPVHRPLVSMCVQREAGPESLWLPLFAGPLPSRLPRLLRWWRGGAPAIPERP